MPFTLAVLLFILELFGVASLIGSILVFSIVSVMVGGAAFPAAVTGRGTIEFLIDSELPGRESTPVSS